MKIHNLLPTFSECIHRWSKRPSLEEFERSYFAPVLSKFELRFASDVADFYSALLELDWEKYRSQVLSLHPIQEEARLRKHLRGVEDLVGVPLQGEAILFGAFGTMDGYARFHHGAHQVYLGIDESYHLGNYIDILETHELTHVVRESRPEVWEGFGIPALNIGMSNNDFTRHQPVIEHLLGEGFSCVISELLVPGADPWNYAYQTSQSLPVVLSNGPAIDREIRKELRHPDGDYGALYNPRRYGHGMPRYSHYVWAWQWVKKLLKDHADGDPKKLVSICSREFIDHALEFELARDAAIGL